MLQSRSFAPGLTGIWFVLSAVMPLSACVDSKSDDMGETTPGATLSTSASSSGAPPASTPTATTPATTSAPTASTTPTGPTGSTTTPPAGPTGPTGNTGATGATGSTGNTGATGDTGATGAGGAGDTGATGSTGAVGGTGDTGATGGAGGTGATGADDSSDPTSEVDAGGSTPTEPAGEFSLTSPAWTAGEECTPDAKDACDDIPVENRAMMIGGDNVMPMISWTPGPEGTQSYVIIYQDLANGFAHWAMWNIPADVTSVAPDNIPEGVGQAALSGNTWFGSGACANVYQLSVHALSEPMINPSNHTAARDQIEADDGTLVLATAFGRVTPKAPCGQ